jgi:hypothetical protein
VVEKDGYDLSKLLREAELAREELLLKRTGSFNSTFSNLDDYSTNIEDLDYLIQELKKKLGEMIQ